ncbi:1-acyl-sn-glycerol-3-phosphate acyltransferase [Burkholderiaceae bacterium DAT-1]|nr:1-acyl-sn-glycerol-3-phosphate acyltransferase [Burkholderiaceae bacterium DAT-1]
MNFLRAVYSVYVAILFLVLCTLGMPVYALASFTSVKTCQQVIAWYNRTSMRLWGVLAFMPISIDGEEHRTHRAMVMVGNHCNLLDMPVTAAAIYQPTRVLAKAEFARIPVLGFLMSRFCVLVSRDSAASRKQSAEAMVAALQSGESILVFPEGTRNRGKEPVQAFKDGAFRAAIAAQVPIQPFVQINMRCGQLFGKILFQPYGLRVCYLPAIPTVGMTEEDVAMLRDQTRQAIDACLRAEDDWFKTH